VTAIVFSPDGRSLASSGADGIKVWDSVGGKHQRTLRNTGNRTDQQNVEPVVPLTISPDGKTLISNDGDNISLWDHRTGERRGWLKGHTQPVASLAFSPDGRTLASGSGDTTVRLWDAETRQERATLSGHTGTVVSLAFSPDGKTLASADAVCVKLWEACSRADQQTGQTPPSDKGAGLTVTIACSGPVDEPGELTPPSLVPVPTRRVRSGRAFTCAIQIGNRDVADDSAVRLVVTFPFGMAPVKSGTSGPTDCTLQGQQVSFAPTANMATQETLSYHVRANAFVGGELRIRAEVTSRRMTAPVVVDQVVPVFRH
jgi:hypothetical protein